MAWPGRVQPPPRHIGVDLALVGVGHDVPPHGGGAFTHVFAGVVLVKGLHRVVAQRRVEGGLHHRFLQQSLQLVDEGEALPLGVGKKSVADEDEVENADDQHGSADGDVLEEARLNPQVIQRVDAHQIAGCADDGRAAANTRGISSLPRE